MRPTSSWGWTFSLSRTIDVTALGALGTEGWNGFQDPHDVGIYRMSDQALVASASLPWPWNSGIGFFENGFRYISLTDPVTLPPDEYEILMTMPAGTIDSQYYSATNVTKAQGITWLHSVFNDGDRLRYLTEIVGAYEKGMFGPNFQFVAAAPEPATLALAALGLTALGFTRRRRQ